MGYVKEGTCGTCINYSYEGEYTKGYCSYYKTYYYHDETCRNWEENTNVTGGSGSSGGCFVTTACCRYRGMSDDCRELTAVRALRDHHLKNTFFGRELIKLYYDNAPAVVEAIDKRGDRAEIYDEILKRLEKIAALSENGGYDEAAGEYAAMMLWIEALVLPGYEGPEKTAKEQ